MYISWIWTYGCLFYTLGSSLTFLYFVAQMLQLWPLGNVPFCSCVFFTPHKYRFVYLVFDLTQQDVAVSSLIFPAHVLESATCPRSLVSFPGEWYEKQRCGYYVYSLLLGFPCFQTNSADRRYMCVY